MKKKLIALVTALTLCAVVVVGATLAYYSTETDIARNTFTHTPDDTDPDPEIKEPNWPELPDITPGTAIPKDPFIQLMNEDAEGEYFVAFVISGSSVVEGLKNLGAILADDTDDTDTVLVPKQNPDGSYEYDSDGEIVYEPIPLYKDYGIAKIFGWSQDYTYQKDAATGNVFAYYQKRLSNQVKYDGNNGATATNVSAPVFQAVITNKNVSHFFDGLKDEDHQNIFDIILKGYVVACVDDTTILSMDSSNNPVYGDFASCEAAMQTAFPEVFLQSDGTNWPSAGRHPVTGGYPYSYPKSLPNNAPDFQPESPFGPGFNVGP